jgi:Protein of unknown function (DUF3027)
VSPTTRTRAPVLDPAGAEAVDLARAAAVEEAGDPALVGGHLDIEVDGDRVVTHSFACLSPAYRGWRWAVTVARASRSRTVTVDEVVLLPGVDAVLAPAWVPWSERLRPDDLGVGDLLPTLADDWRLEPGYAATGDADADQLAIWELGLGRNRVLSPDGRDDAAERWYAGERGPASAMAQAAPGRCTTCGFFLLLAGSMRLAFGVCANAYSPADGEVVSGDHGCGAHSEALVLPPSSGDAAGPVIDEFGYDVVTLSPSPPSLETARPGSVDDAPSSEELGHS